MFPLVFPKSTIEKGRIINKEKNWKNRNYDTYVIAGNGKINGTPSIVGVVVKAYPNQNINNKFYVHEIIKIGTTSDGAVDYDALSVNEKAPIHSKTIPQSEHIVKPKFSKEIPEL